MQFLSKALSFLRLTPKDHFFQYNVQLTMMPVLSHGSLCMHTCCVGLGL